jgi:ketosteroid isomerase-like protein
MEEKFVKIILQAQVLNVEERLRMAMLNSDIDVLDELIAPDLLFTSHMGQLVSKEDDLALHRVGILRLMRLKPSQQIIQVHQGFAVVSVLMHVVGNYEDSPIDQNTRYTRVWSIASDGSLQLIAGHMSEIPSG